MRDGVWFSKDGERALLVARNARAGLRPGRAGARRSTPSARAFADCAGRPAARGLRCRSPARRRRGRRARHRRARRRALVADRHARHPRRPAARLPLALAGRCSPRCRRRAACWSASPRSACGSARCTASRSRFAAILIGEAVDYPTYLYAQAGRGEALETTLARIGATLRLAVLTTACGALSMLLSSFNGLAQLGLLTIAGVIVAGLVTRWVLPALTPARILERKLVRLPFDARAARPRRRRATPGRSLPRSRCSRARRAVARDAALGRRPVEPHAAARGASRRSTATCARSSARPMPAT